MTLFPGYEVLEKTGEGFKTRLYRGYRLGDQKPVILKVPRAAYPPLEDIAQLKHEYEIASTLEIDGILKPLALVRFGHLPTLILEDFEGKALNNFTSEFKSDPANFLRVAIQLSEILGVIHQNNLIHKQINPDNILFDPTTKRVKITGFGGASRLAGEKLSPDKESLPDGSASLLNVDGVTAVTGGNPTDMALSHNGHFLYVLVNATSSIAVFAIGADGSLEPLPSLEGTPGGLAGY